MVLDAAKIREYFYAYSEYTNMENYDYSAWLDIIVEDYADDWLIIANIVGYCNRTLGLSAENAIDALIALGFTVENREEDD